MYSFLTIDFVCLNFRTVEKFVDFLKTNNILIDIFADLKGGMVSVSLTMPAKPNTTMDAKHVFLIFSQVLMFNTNPKELAFHKASNPISFLLYVYPAAHHFFAVRLINIDMMSDEWCSVMKKYRERKGRDGGKRRRESRTQNKI